MGLFCGMRVFEGLGRAWMGLMGGWMGGWTR
jgi:hypothetical protein